MNKGCSNSACRYAFFCLHHGQCSVVTSETKKGIANSVANMVCSDWKKFSFSSMLENDGAQLEKIIHNEQISKGFTACFRAPY